MIAIVDYQAGNLASVKKALDHLGHDAEITSSPEVVARAERIVLPGVGHFSATSRLEQSGLRDAIADAIARGTPFLGICVGMQWMFLGSEEAPSIRGLGALSAVCSRFNSDVKAPHVGWNTVLQRGSSRLLDGLSAEFFVYYTHSYRAPATPETCGISEYGGAFSAVVESRNLLGVQFHPEKSGEAGLRILDNFARLSC
ncbi:MAG TPA: imidazole glycerol phosphate synthase subunit HisH [Terriglobales bacterium]|nr:imidazole glycerol phosphate synthase subunit HisH [Terriglobales bacterium]